MNSLLAPQCIYVSIKEDDSLTTLEEALPETTKDLYNYWLGIRTQAQIEINKLRVICKHVNTSETKSYADDGYDVTIHIHCDDCGAYIKP